MTGKQPDAEACSRGDPSFPAQTKPLTPGTPLQPCSRLPAHPSLTPSPQQPLLHVRSQAGPYLMKKMRPSPQTP